MIPPLRSRRPQCLRSPAARPAPVPLTEKDILCLGHLRRVFPLLDRLHDVGCDRDSAGNRELFFRIFKQLLGPRHLLSQRQEGIDIQVHCTVIVCLLPCLIAGKKPTQSNRSMIGWYLIGLATEQELPDHLNKPDHTGVKLRAKDELWKKMGF